MTEPEYRTVSHAIDLELFDSFTGDPAFALILELRALRQQLPDAKTLVLRLESRLCATW